MSEADGVGEPEFFAEADDEADPVIIGDVDEEIVVVCVLSAEGVNVLDDVEESDLAAVELTLAELDDDFDTMADFVELGLTVDRAVTTAVPDTEEVDDDVAETQVVIVDELEGVIALEAEGAADSVTATVVVGDVEAVGDMEMVDETEAVALPELEKEKMTEPVTVRVSVGVGVTPAVTVTLEVGDEDSVGTELGDAVAGAVTVTRLDRVARLDCVTAELLDGEPEIKLDKVPTAEKVAVTVFVLAAVLELVIDGEPDTEGDDVAENDTRDVRDSPGERLSTEVDDGDEVSVIDGSGLRVSELSGDCEEDILAELDVDGVTRGEPVPAEDKEIVAEEVLLCDRGAVLVALEVNVARGEREKAAETEPDGVADGDRDADGEPDGDLDIVTLPDAEELDDCEAATDREAIADIEIGPDDEGSGDTVRVDEPVLDTDGLAVPERIGEPVQIGEIVVEPVADALGDLEEADDSEINAEIVAVGVIVGLADTDDV